MVLDPFSGSGICAIEAVRAGRKAYSFDLNPLSAFMIEVYASKFEQSEFLTAIEAIRAKIASLQAYQENFEFTADGRQWTVKNFHWRSGAIEKIAAEDQSSERRVFGYKELKNDFVGKRQSYRVDGWYPTNELPEHPSINTNFLSRIGGDTIDKLWTTRNLQILSAIFEEIEDTTDRDIRLQLLASFIQTIHLCSRMVVPRNPGSNRDFSGSWGRPDFMVRNRELEQNPLDVFLRSATGRQGTLAMMKDRNASFPKGIKIHDVGSNGKIRPSADINYGILDVTDLAETVGSRKADFALTDPPYAGLVRYLPLSVIWLSWLQKIDQRFAPRLADELTLFDATEASRQQYRRKLRSSIEQIHKATKPQSKMVLTFHHQDVREFNEVIHAVNVSGYIVDKVTHQYNRRSGESNVSNPYGVSGSDFYIRCVKQRGLDFSSDNEDLERFILTSAERIIAARNEPTPYDLLFQSLWPELIQAGFVAPMDSHTEAKRVLQKFRDGGGPFVTLPASDKSGEHWWFAQPEKHIRFPDRPLASRVEESVRKYLRRHVAARFDDILAHIFQEYPNGLTPNPRRLTDILAEVATASGGKWRIKPEAVAEATKHTDAIWRILTLRREGSNAYVGRREQHEVTESGRPLRQFADLTNLSDLNLASEAISRIEMVDVAFVRHGALECIWEVENSTNFMSAIQRGSNASAAVPKVMVIPENREQELARISDPLFRSSFAEQGWKYLTYRDLRRAERFKGNWRLLFKQARTL